MYISTHIVFECIFQNGTLTDQTDVAVLSQGKINQAISLFKDADIDRQTELCGHVAEFVCLSVIMTFAGQKLSAFPDQAKVCIKNNSDLVSTYSTFSPSSVRGLKAH